VSELHQQRHEQESIPILSICQPKDPSGKINPFNRSIDDCCETGLCESYLVHIHVSLRVLIFLSFSQRYSDSFDCNVQAQLVHDRIHAYLFMNSHLSTCTARTSIVINTGSRCDRPSESLGSMRRRVAIIRLVSLTRIRRAIILFFISVSTTKEIDKLFYYKLWPLFWNPVS
jgi:hypothetical protein